LAKAYAGAAIPTKWDPDGRPISSSSQPGIMAIMLEQLGVKPGQRVLRSGPEPATTPRCWHTSSARPAR